MRSSVSWEPFLRANPAATWAEEEGGIVAANACAVELLGGASETDVLGMCPILAPDSAAETGFAETSLRTASGSLVPARILCWPADEATSGRPRRLVQAVPIEIPMGDLDVHGGCEAPTDNTGDGLRSSLLGSIADCIKLLTIDGRLIYMNPGGLSLMRIDEPAQVLGAPWLDFWSGEHRRSAETSLQRAVAGTVDRFVGQCPRADGELRWWDVVNSPVCDRDGKVTHLLSISRDITDLKHAQQFEFAERRVLENIASDKPLPDTLDRIARLLEAKLGRLAYASVLVVQDAKREMLRVASCPAQPLLRDAAFTWEELETDMALQQQILLRAQATEFQDQLIHGPDEEVLGRIVVWTCEAVPLDRTLLGEAANLAAIALARDTFLRRLRSKQDRLAAIDRAAPVGLYQVDEHGNWVFANERHTELTGLTPDECAGEGWLNSVHPEDRDAVITAWRKARAEDGQFSAEYRLLTKRADSVQRWAIAVESPAVAMPGRIGTVTDVTDTHTAQEQFQTLANNMSQFCWMADAKGWIFWYNQRWYDYTGTTLEQMQGWGWGMVHHPDHVERVVQHWQRHLDAGEPWEDTFPLRGTDGTYRWFLSRAIPIRDGHGNILRWFGTNTDITEIRELESALHSQNLALQRSNEDLSRFAFFASHDLQEPLRSISNYAELARREAESGSMEKAIERLNTVLGAAGRMDRLIRDLLRYAQTSAEVEPAKAPVRVSDALDRVLSDLSEDVVAAGAEFAVEPLPTVRCNEDQLSQVLGNYISNSLKYRRVHVPLKIRVYAEESGPSHWKIVVQDNGQGFAEEHAQHVFEFLRRLHGRAVAGSGIGLAICKTIIERHGGKVGAQATLGHGATFWFTLHRA